MEIGMRKSKFTESQIVAILAEGDAGLPVAEVCRKHGISNALYYQWKSKYGGLEASELRRMKDLEAENARLKRMYAELALDNAATKDLIAKNCRTGAEARGGAIPDRSACAAAEPVLSLRGAVAGGLVCAAAGLDGARCRADRCVGRAG